MRAGVRTAAISRKTKETEIDVAVDLAVAIAHSVRHGVARLAVGIAIDECERIGVAIGISLLLHQGCESVLDLHGWSAARRRVRSALQLSGEGGRL